MSTLLIIILILALVGGLPRWNYSRDWGYGPSGVLSVVVVLLLLMAFTNHI
jgi:Protein of unknown function (DUF3309)